VHSVSSNRVVNNTGVAVPALARSTGKCQAVESMITPKPTKARFFEPMLLLATHALPEGDDWEYELKLDGYRAIGFKTKGRVHLRSRNNKDFAARYPAIAKALEKLPDETVIDGEVVAFDHSGRPSFNTLQNYGSSTAPIFYYAFDVLILAGKDVRSEPLETRRELLRSKCRTDDIHSRRLSTCNSC
jgi:ATP-dependent DNA ligase